MLLFLGCINFFACTGIISFWVVGLRERSFFFRFTVYVHRWNKHLLLRGCSKKLAPRAIIQKGRWALSFLWCLCKKHDSKSVGNYNVRNLSFYFMQVIYCSGLDVMFCLCSTFELSGG